MDYSKHISTKKTAQTKPIPGKNMVANSAGGFSHAVSMQSRLERFLILGSEGGSYYATESKLTEENAQATIAAIKEDGELVVNTIVAISQAGRAPKNDPAIFALALAATHGNADTKQAAYAAIPLVCRTGTHLFTFCQAIQNMRGWSRGLRSGVARWYTQRSDKALASQLIKYRQRNGWTHRDVLRLAHASPQGFAQAQLFGWAVGNTDVNPGPQVEAFLSLQVTTNAKTAAKLIRENGLPWEAVPTSLLNEKLVWEALLAHMGITAIIRNLGKMTSVGVLQSGLNGEVKAIVSQLKNSDVLKEGRVHPLNLLVALRTYSQGHGMKGNLSWDPVSSLVSALEIAFYLSFDTVESTGKNHFLALDVSGSMTSRMCNLPISCTEASAAMAMVALRTEKHTDIMGFADSFRKLGITASDTLETARAKAYKSNFGSTDCSLPMVYAKKHKIPVDAFCVYTDNETYAGAIHPSQALDAYRQATGRNAKLIVLGMTSSGFTIADPSDVNSMDVVGFDTSVPAVMADFIKS